MKFKSSLFIFAILTILFVSQSQQDCTIEECLVCSKDSTCFHNQICDTCNEGFILTTDKKQCGEQISGCMFLNSEDPTKCEICFQGKTITSDKQSCVNEIEFCKEVDADNLGQCLTCQDGFMHSTDLTKCRPALQNCVSASNGANFVCDDCAEGYQIYAEQYGTFCYPQIENCQQFANKPTLCDTCVAGFFPNGLKTACIQTTNDCGIGFIDDGSGQKCIQIGAPCAQGFFDDGSGVKCVNAEGVCAEGFFFDQDFVACVSNTANCGTLATCIGNGAGTGCTATDADPAPACHEDFQYDAGSSKCVILDTICVADAGLPLKDTTQDGEVCVAECPLNTKDDGTGKRCIPFGEHCSDGFYDDGTGTNCLDFDDGFTCAEGYKNDGTDFRCIPKGSKCAKGYKNNGQDLCVQIDPSYDDQNGNCAQGFKVVGIYGDCIRDKTKCPTNYRNQLTSCGLNPTFCPPFAALERCILESQNCDTNLLVDDGKGNCIPIYDECAQGYKNVTFIYYSLCIPVSVNCPDLLRDDGTGLKCIRYSQPCAQGFKDDGRGLCIPVGDSCPIYFYELLDKSCVASCPRGFTKNDVTRKCDSPTKYCKTYDHNLQCSECWAGYLLSNKTKTCFQEVKDCKYYDKVGNCIECQEGFDLFRNTCFDSAQKQYAPIDGMCFSNLNCQVRVSQVFNTVPSEKPERTPQLQPQFKFNYFKIIELGYFMGFG